jgi:hypothetical protein
MIGLWVLPVDEPDSLRLLSNTRPDLCPVAQEAVYVLVGFVQISAAAERGVAFETIDRTVD